MKNYRIEFENGECIDAPGNTSEYAIGTLISRKAFKVKLKKISPEYVALGDDNDLEYKNEEGNVRLFAGRDKKLVLTFKVYRI